jgi:hypothetical protein
MRRYCDELWQNAATGQETTAAKSLYLFAMAPERYSNDIMRRIAALGEDNDEFGKIVLVTVP